MTNARSMRCASEHGYSYGWRLHQRGGEPSVRRMSNPSFKFRYPYYIWRHLDTKHEPNNQDGFPSYHRFPLGVVAESPEKATSYSCLHMYRGRLSGFECVPDEMYARQTIRHNCRVPLWYFFCVLRLLCARDFLFEDANKCTPYFKFVFAPWREDIEPALLGMCLTTPGELPRPVSRISIIVAVARISDY